jgi:hypothetical protein
MCGAEWTYLPYGGKFRVGEIRCRSESPPLLVGSPLKFYRSQPSLSRVHVPLQEPPCL